jgi:hypothetical protein
VARHLFDGLVVGQELLAGLLVFVDHFEGVGSPAGHSESEESCSAIRGSAP